MAFGETNVLYSLVNVCVVSDAGIKYFRLLSLLFNILSRNEPVYKAIIFIVSFDFKV